jgi:hypothetical protein
MRAPRWDSTHCGIEIPRSCSAKAGVECDKYLMHTIEHIYMVLFPNIFGLGGDDVDSGQI